MPVHADRETDAGRMHDIVQGGMSNPDDVGMAACGARWTACPTSRVQTCRGALRPRPWLKAATPEQLNPARVDLVRVCPEREERSLDPYVRPGILNHAIGQRDVSISAGFSILSKIPHPDGKMLHPA